MLYVTAEQVFCHCQSCIELFIITITAVTSEELTLFQYCLHFSTGLVIVDKNIKTQVFKAFEQFSRISICAIAYIHPLHPYSKITISFLCV